jgi:hypothetical protein
VLDKAVVDRDGHEMGRADGIVLALQDGQPPRLDAILIGPIALGCRVHAGVGRIMRALDQRLGLDGRRPVRVDFRDLTSIERTIKVRLAIGDTAADAVEQRLRGWLLKLPGNR